MILFPGPSAWSGFSVRFIFPDRLKILAVTLSDSERSNKILVWGNSKTDPDGENILGWQTIFSVSNESTITTLSDLNAAYIPNFDNCVWIYGMLFTLIIEPPKGDMFPVDVFTSPIYGL